MGPRSTLSPRFLIGGTGGPIPKQSSAIQLNFFLAKIRALSQTQIKKFAKKNTNNKISYGYPSVQKKEKNHFRFFSNTSLHFFFVPKGTIFIIGESGEALCRLYFEYF